QQRRNEEAGEHEKAVDALVAVQPLERRGGVKENDEDDAEGADTVQHGEVGLGLKILEARSKVRAHSSARTMPEFVRARQIRGMSSGPERAGPSSALD